MIRRLEYLVIGNPDNRRIALFQAALKRCGANPACVLAYRDLLDDSHCLARWLEQWQQRAAPSSRLCIRLESPGENAEVEQLLIRRGLTLSQRKLRLKHEHGRILHPKEWFAGYSNLLEQVSQEVAACDRRAERIRFTSQPQEILLAFEKPRCHKFLSTHGIAVPDALTGVESYEHLIECMRTLGWSRVFAKLATGSSASGVVALHVTSSCVRALTSMEMTGVGRRAKFYNNLRLRCYTREQEVASIVNFLCAAGMHVERWLPKAGLGDRSFDLRMVAISGRPLHCVVRTSRSPITNLHLGNRRGDFDLLRQRMSRRAWLDVLELARQTAAVFPGSHMLGLDILLQPGFRRPTILEVNAFGDLLPGVMVNNQDTYEAQVRALRWSSLRQER